MSYLNEFCDNPWMIRTLIHKKVFYGNILSCNGIQSKFITMATWSYGAQIYLLCNFRYKILPKGQVIYFIYLIFIGEFHMKFHLVFRQVPTVFTTFLHSNFDPRDIYKPMLRIFMQRAKTTSRPYNTGRNGQVQLKDATCFIKR